MDIVSILESIYLVYMYNFLKTTYSIHHPFEYILRDSEIWKHPINTGIYENKICEVGSYASILGGLLLLYRGLGYKTSKKYTKWIVLTWVIVAFTTNINALLYIIPIVIIEALLFI